MLNFKWHATALLGVVLVSGSGCGSDTVSSPSNKMALAYRSLRLNQHAITMAVSAPYNTIQLQATPMTSDGTPIANTGTVQYRVIGTDTSITVSPTGLVTAHAPTYQDFTGQPMLRDANGNPVSVSGVIASLTVQGVTLADTAAILVTATAPTVSLASLSIQPPADSLSFYQSGAWLRGPSVNGGGTAISPDRQLRVVQLDANGTPVDNPVVFLTSSDKMAIYLGGGHWMPHLYGLVANSSATITIQTWYYGVARNDSLRIKVGYPQGFVLFALERTPFQSTTTEAYWYPANIDVSAPVRLQFRTYSEVPLDVVFDDPANVQEDTIGKKRIYGWGGSYPQVYGSGNIAPFYYDTVGGDAACNQAMYDGTTRAADSVCSYINTGQVGLSVRVISTPGTYTYHTLFGNGGKIVVH